MEKRGQFFLLAAVIISAAIISLNAGINRVTTNEEPGDFYDFSHEVKQEVGSVLDYKVYNMSDSGVNLTLFIEALAEEIKDRSPGSEFLFIYGNETVGMTVRNFGTQDVYADGQNIPGSGQGAPNRICIRDMCQNITDSGLSEKAHDADILPSSDKIFISMGGVSFDFPIPEYTQVIFVMQKNVGGDRHVIIE